MGKDRVEDLAVAVHHFQVFIGLAHHHYAGPVTEQVMQLVHDDQAVAVAQGVGLIDRHTALYLKAQRVVAGVGALRTDPAEVGQAHRVAVYKSRHHTPPGRLRAW